MVIQHNLSAGNTDRQMGIVKGDKAKSTERLSSDIGSIGQQMMQQVYRYLKRCENKYGD